MPRGGDGLTIHRMKSLPKSVLVDGVPTFPVAEALVSSWPLLSGPDRRAPAITAARDRLVTPAQLKTALQAASRLAGRAELVELVRLLDEGCESELEIWGYLDVFSIPGLRHASRRKWVDARGRRYRLDLAYEVERVAIELDGARYHTGKARWELDRRRVRRGQAQSKVRVTAFFHSAYSSSRWSAGMLGSHRLSAAQFARISSVEDQNPTASPAA
jgi:hypothetical protein